MSTLPDDWEVKSFENLFNFGGGFSASREQLSGEGHCYLHYGDIHKSPKTFIDVREEQKQIPKLDIPLDRISSRSLLCDGDVVFVDASEDYEGVNKHIVVLNKEGIPFISGLHTIVAKSKTSDLDNGFKRFCFQSNEIKKQFCFYAVGTKVSGISKTNIAKIVLALPPLPEQIEIARILSVWDAAIGDASTLLAAKTQLKRALMQQLLTGKRRFREFVESGSTQDPKNGPRPADWSDLTIGDFAYEVSERAGSDQSFPVLSCTKYAGLVDSLKYFGKRIFSENIAAYKVVRRDQFAYATNHIEEGSIGLLTDLEAGVVSPMYTVFDLSEKVRPAFLYLLFKTEMYRHIFASNTSASVDRRGSLRWRQFSQIRVALPSKPEQEKIAAAASIFDSEIQLLQTQLAALQQQKKGLMQKLLSGQVRVQVAAERTGQMEEEYNTRGES